MGPSSGSTSLSTFLKPHHASTDVDGDSSARVGAIKQKGCATNCERGGTDLQRFEAVPDCSIAGAVLRPGTTMSTRLRVFGQLVLPRMP